MDNEVTANSSRNLKSLTTDIGDMNLNWLKFLPLSVLLWFSVFPKNAMALESHEEVQESTKVFTEINRESKTRIPSSLLRRSQAIAILTNVTQGGFIFGVRRGDGVILIRKPNGGWSNPAFITITGGSFGLQAGARSSDVILVFPSQTALKTVLSGAFEFGGSVSGTAGPVGEQPVESLEGFNGDKVYTYSRSEGLFGGVTLEGSDLDDDDELNKEFYGQPLTAIQIFQRSSMQAPVVVDSLKQVIQQAETGIR